MNHTCDALRPCPSRHGILVWTCGSLHHLAHLLGDCPCHQPPRCRRQRCLSPGRWSSHATTCQLLRHEEQKVGVSDIVQHESHVLCTHARRSESGPTSRSNVRCELEFVELEWHLWFQIQNWTWDRVSNFWRPSTRISQCIQRATSPRRDTSTFQCLPPCGQLTQLDQTLGACCPSVQILLWMLTPAFPVLSCRCLFRILSALPEQRRPPTFRESLKTFRQLALVYVPSSWRSVQQEPWQQEKKAPTSLLTNRIQLGCFFHGQLLRTAMRASEKMRH